MKIQISLSGIADKLKATDATKYKKLVADIAKHVAQLKVAKTTVKRKEIRAKLVKFRSLKATLTLRARAADAAKIGKKRDAAFAKTNPEVAKLKKQFQTIKNKKDRMTGKKHHMDWTPVERKAYKDLDKQLVDINAKMVKLGHGNKTYEHDQSYNPD